MHDSDCACSPAVRAADDELLAHPESIDDVPCKRCKAFPGQGCRTPSGNPANEPHSARVDAFWATRRTP